MNHLPELFESVCQWTFGRNVRFLLLKTLEQKSDYNYRETQPMVSKISTTFAERNCHTR